MVYEKVVFDRRGVLPCFGFADVLGILSGSESAGLASGQLGCV